MILESRPDVIGRTKRNLMKNYKIKQLYPFQWESMQENMYHPLALWGENEATRKPTSPWYNHGFSPQCTRSWPFGVRMRRLRIQPPQGTTMGSHPSVLAPGPIGVRMRRLRSQPPHGTTMGSHPR